MRRRPCAEPLHRLRHATERACARLLPVGRRALGRRNMRHGRGGLRGLALGVELLAVADAPLGEEIVLDPDDLADGNDHGGATGHGQGIM